MIFIILYPYKLINGSSTDGFSITCTASEHEAYQALKSGCLVYNLDEKNRVKKIDVKFTINGEENEQTISDDV